MPQLTEAQRTRILDAFKAMDHYGYADQRSTAADFYYEGYVTIEGLVQVAAVIAQIHAEIAADTPRSP